MDDYLVKALAYEGQVRAYAVNTTQTIQEAQRRHDSWPTASAALGRSMTAGVMLGAMSKGNEKISIKINGGGPLGNILIDTNAVGEVRGYVSNPHTHFDLNEFGILDVRKAVGFEGMLTVSKDIGLQQPFVGHVPLMSGEIGEDFASYLTHSEQTASAVGVGVLVNTDNTIQIAGGFIIQLMPGASEDIISALEEHLKVMSPISSLMADGLTPEQLLMRIVGAENLEVLETVPVQFQCQCSAERITNAIVSLGKEEIEDMIQTDGQAEANCHFCNETYHFTKENLEQLKETAR